MIWTGVLALACGGSAHDGTQASASPETGPALESLAAEARALRRESKDPESLQLARNLLYEYLSLADLPDISGRHLDDKMALVRRANAIRTLGHIHRDLEEYGAALAHLRTALLLVHETGLSWHIAMTLRDIGRTHEAAGDPEMALSTYREASDHAEATEDDALKEILHDKLTEMRPGLQDARQ